MSKDNCPECGHPISEHSFDGCHHWFTPMDCCLCEKKGEPPGEAKPTFSDAVAELAYGDCPPERGCGLLYHSSKLTREEVCHQCRVHAILALHEQEQRPLVEALKEAKLRLTEIQATANAPYSVRVDARKALTKIDAALEGRVNDLHT